MEKIGEIIKRVDKKELVKTVRQQSENLSDNACPICNGGEFVHPVVNGTVDYNQVVPCECSLLKRQTEKQQALMKFCQLPEGSKSLTFDNFKVYPAVQEAYQAAKDVAEGKLKWLILSGDVDLGKTHLAIAICREWLKQGNPARYAYVPLLLDELRKGFELQGEQSYQYQFDFFCKVSLLVLDDLGTEKRSDWVQEKLDTIVDYRYINQLPLVVTTNLAINELPVRISSRLQRYANSKVIAIEDKEYRLRRMEKR